MIDEFVKMAEYCQSKIFEEIFDDLCFEDRKEKEILLAKKGKGHYRCIVNAEKNYEQIMLAISPYMAHFRCKSK